MRLQAIDIALFIFVVLSREVEGFCPSHSVPRMLVQHWCSSTEDENEYTDSTNEELRIILKDRGLKKSGTKQEMIDRILANNEEEAFNADLYAAQELEAEIEGTIAYYNGLTNAALREVLQDRGLKKSGTKQEMIDRLLWADISDREEVMMRDGKVLFDGKPHLSWD